MAPSQLDRVMLAASSRPAAPGGADHHQATPRPLCVVRSIQFLFRSTSSRRIGLESKPDLTIAATSPWRRRQSGLELLPILGQQPSHCSNIIRRASGCSTISTTTALVMLVGPSAGSKADYSSAPSLQRSGRPSNQRPQPPSSSALTSLCVCGLCECNVIICVCVCVCVQYVALMQPYSYRVFFFVLSHSISYHRYIL